MKAGLSVAKVRLEFVKTILETTIRSLKRETVMQLEADYNELHEKNTESGSEEDRTDGGNISEIINHI